MKKTIEKSVLEVTESYVPTSDITKQGKEFRRIGKALKKLKTKIRKETQ